MDRVRWKKCIQLSMIIFLLMPAGQSIAASKWSIVSTTVGQGAWGMADGEKAQYQLPTYAVMDEQGVIYIADTGNHLIRQVTSDGQVTTIAGNMGEKDEYGQPLGDYADGFASQALFNQPKGLAIAADGSLFIADAGNGMIRVLDPLGNVSTFAKDLLHPSSVVLDQSGNLYVSESLVHQIVKFTPDGTKTVLAGGYYEEQDGSLVGSYRDGDGEVAQFNEPSGLALGDDGTLYIADTGNQRIRSLSPEGKVSTVAGSGTDLLDYTSYVLGGYKDGIASEAQFQFPNGLAVAEDGTIYVADTSNHRLREITTDGLVRTIAGDTRPGHIDGIGIRSSFNHPTDVLITGEGSLIVVDRWNHRLRSLSWEFLPPRDIDEGLRIVWNRNVLHFGVPPKIMQGRTMVTAQQFGELLGYEVHWDEVMQQVTMSNGEKTIYVSVGEQKINSGDISLRMDVAPIWEEEQVWVPLRFIAEAFGIYVSWIEEDQTVLILH